LKKLTIALAGNPNSGKTSVFNNLTGSRQHVGNYPGVTVEKKEGDLKFQDYDIHVVDLPGIYSLTAYSIDEMVARNFIIDEKPDIVINIVDSSNIERNLYLTTQLMELNVPIIIVLNMFDLAAKHGTEINLKDLSNLLGIPIVSTVATKKIGMEDLLNIIVETDEGKNISKKNTVNYGKEIEGEIQKLKTMLMKDEEIRQKYSLRWLSVKLIENDENVLKIIQNLKNSNEIEKEINKSNLLLNKFFNDSPDAVIADKRYGFISGACSEAVKISYEVRHTISDKIDTFLINRVLGLPIFLIVIWILFNITFKLSEPLMQLIELGQDNIGNTVSELLPAGSAIQSLIVEGVIGGVGSVLVFVPIIFLLFFIMSILEDTGYMARAAFIMDRLMHKIGLHGRSFIPMLLGFGCNLPAIMATRTIEDRKDRFVTILINPFMSCGARLPVYTLFLGAFFAPKYAGNILFLLYFIGIAVAVIMAKILRKYIFKGEAAPFVMELPPYRVPTLKALFIHMWERGGVYLKKAGTVIFLGVVFVWFLSNFPWNPALSKDYTTLIEQADGNVDRVKTLEDERAEERLERSLAGIFGKFITPVFKPIGFDDWRLSVGLVGGFIAKEIVVSTIGTLYSVSDVEEGSENLREKLRDARGSDGEKLYTPLKAFAIMVFVLLYIPCLATLAIIRRETNSWKWTGFAVLYTTVIAWVMAFFIYQGGRLIGLG